MAEHLFHLKAHWPGGRNSCRKNICGNLKTEVSISTEMDRPGVGQIQIKCY